MISSAVSLRYDHPDGGEVAIVKTSFKGKLLFIGLSPDFASDGDSGTGFVRDSLRALSGNETRRCHSIGGIVEAPIVLYKALSEAVVGDCLHLKCATDDVYAAVWGLLKVEN